MNAFLTGSQVYGEPNKDSDIDLVLSMTINDTKQLVEVLNAKGQTVEHVDYGDGQSSIKIGFLNLIICHSEKREVSWRLGTSVLIRERKENMRPLKRSRAIEVFSGLREMLGLKNGKQ